MSQRVADATADVLHVYKRADDIQTAAANGALGSEEARVEDGHVREQCWTCLVPIHSSSVRLHANALTIAGAFSTEHV